MIIPSPAEMAYQTHNPCATPWRQLTEDQRQHWAHVVAAALGARVVHGLVLGERVRKTRGDYTFEGEIRSVFEKQSGVVRVVVEGDEHMLMIMNPEMIEPTIPLRMSSR